MTRGDRKKISLFFNLVSRSEISLRNIGNNRENRKGGLAIYLRDEILYGYWNLSRQYGENFSSILDPPCIF